MSCTDKVIEIDCIKSTKPLGENKLYRKDNAELFESLKYTKDNYLPGELIPDLSVEVNSGWLTGANRGEWGGEVVLIQEKKEPQVLLNKNVEDIYKINEKYYVTTGLAHLSFNHGEIYSVNIDSSKKSRLIAKLKGEPQSS